MGRNVTTPPAVPPSSIKSIQRGRVSVVNSGTTVTISPVDPLKSVVILVGNNGTTASILTGLSSTQITLLAPSSGTVIDTSWQVVEYN